MGVNWSDPNYWYLIAAAAVAVVGVGRATRILTYDSFPPAVAVRVWWATLTKDGQWGLLARCFWCASPWMMLICMGWFYVGTLVPWVGIVWWVFWGWMALSYAAAMTIARDDPNDR